MRADPVGESVGLGGDPKAAASTASTARGASTASTKITPFWWLTGCQTQGPPEVYYGICLTAAAFRWNLPDWGLHFDGISRWTPSQRCHSTDAAETVQFDGTSRPTQTRIRIRIRTLLRTYSNSVSEPPDLESPNRPVSQAVSCTPVEVRRSAPVGIRQGTRLYKSS